ncbi:MAG: FHA domain-containing protein [Verrucomicrobiota bacterium]|nr:FHA domain-containing protein [Verrucomicrobiota bacterium]
MPRLTIRLDSGEKISHDLVDETISLGRSPENSICLSDLSVSSRHAELMMMRENCYLKDLDSTNGTQVNDEPVKSVQLRAGDRVRFGKVEASYECDVPGAAQPLPHLEAAEARPAEMSAKPADFANASPFPNRKKDKDSARTAILAAVAVAALAFLGIMIALFMMQAPTL